jgi:serine acetyltransferase
MTDGTPFGTALVDAIKRISDQLLLYVLAGAIIVATAAIGGVSFVWPLVGLLLAGVVAWTVLQAMRVRGGKPVIGQNVRLGPFSKVVGGIKYGDIRVNGSDSGVEQNVTLGAGGRVEGGITHGDVEIGKR